MKTDLSRVKAAASQQAGRLMRWFGKAKRVRYALMGLGLCAFGLAVLDLAFPPPIEKAFSRSMVVTDRNGVPLRAFPTEEGRWRLPANLEKTDPAFIQALIAIEDERFYHHFGVDGLAVMRAAGSAIHRGKIVSGASTITMQTARLLEPRPRTLSSKIIEMFRALQLERRLSKDEILELYLTLTPYGGNLEGLRAASWAYFGREPDRLTDDQIALLIALPQSPEVRRPDLRPENAKAARKLILARLNTLDLIPDFRAGEAASLPLPKRHAFPVNAWHVSEQIQTNELEARKAKSPGFHLPKDVRSTIDAGLQASLERYVKDQSGQLGDEVQIAAMVVEVETRAVRALVGSASRSRPGGWINLTQMARSPGSTLKPFIYGLAFDDGQAMPETFIQDLPARFNTYRPENFDRAFRGTVRVSDALQHSLNVPAVLALDRIGPERFAAALELSGVSVRIDGGAEKEPGLALALGGAGLTLQDLTKLYASLGDEGLVKPLNWTEAEVKAHASDTGHRFMGEQSATRIVDILKGAPTPAGFMPSNLTQDAPEIAFKTGTSYGFRDAWAAGVARGYAIVVWVGRADGAPRAGETGRKAALPMLFSMFDRVDATLSTQGQASDRLISSRPEQTHNVMSAFARDDAAPVILFPPENAVLLQKGPENPSPGFVLSGRGESALRWYVDGSPVEYDVAGAPVWVPHGPGFYNLSAVDTAGRESRVAVRVTDLTQQ